MSESNYSKKVLLDSEIFSKEGKGVLPFKIVVEEEQTEEKHSVTVRQIVFKSVDNLSIMDEKLLMSSFWKEDNSAT